MQAAGSRVGLVPPAPRETGRGQGRFTQWRVNFCAGTDSGNRIEGHIRFSPHSRWLVLLDLDNDVLAGEYLPDGKSIEVGLHFRIDEYDVLVAECVQVDLRSKTPEIVDLTEKLVPGKPGGRFWALIESDDDEQVDDHTRQVR